MEESVGGVCTGVAEGWDISTCIRVCLFFSIGDRSCVRRCSEECEGLGRSGFTRGGSWIISGLAAMFIHLFWRTHKFQK